MKARRRCLAWEHTVDGWRQLERERPNADEKRPPYPRESVEIHHFWDRNHQGIVFHRRWDPGTFCDPQNLAMSRACGHAMPVEVAMKIARPCRKCWPDAQASRQDPLDGSTLSATGATDPVPEEKS